MFLRRYFLGSFSLVMHLYANSVSAENLCQVYDLAVANDPALHAAFDNLQANRQSLPQAIAVMLPNLSANFNTSGGVDTIQYGGGYNTQNYGITLNQPIFHPEHWAQLEQARHVVKGAVATYVSAQQELIIRVATQYFNILTALDNLTFTQANRKAFAREYDQAKHRFDVGLIAITDVQDAKSKYDSAVADVISAENAVADQYEILREITGFAVKKVEVFPTKTFSLTPPSPNKKEEWVLSAHLFNPDVIAARENTKQRKAFIAQQVAGHFPTFDLQGNAARSKLPPPYPDALAETTSLSLNVNIPIFAGGMIVSRTTQASAQYSESLQQLEAQQRAVDSSARQAYLGVLTAISRVSALAQAVVSSETAYKANQAAYSVGTRTITELLDSESKIFLAQRDLAQARYQYLLEGLKLKQAAGVLSCNDITQINALITGQLYEATVQKG